MKLKGVMRIHCAQCPTKLICTAGTRAEFAAALEERGWRALRGSARGRVVCPACAKKAEEKELSPAKGAA